MGTAFKKRRRREIGWEDKASDFSGSVGVGMAIDRCEPMPPSLPRYLNRALQCETASSASALGLRPRAYRPRTLRSLSPLGE